MTWPLACLIICLAFVVVAASAIALLYVVERVRLTHRHRRIEASEAIARETVARFKDIDEQFKALKHKQMELQAALPARR